MFSAHVQTIGMVLKLTVGSYDPTPAVFSVGCGEAPEPCGPHPVARPRIHRWLYGVLRTMLVVLFFPISRCNTRNAARKSSRDCEIC